MVDDNKEIKKALSTPQSRQIGQPLKTVTANSYINASRKTELVYPKLPYTFDIMCEDSAIKQCVDSNAIPVIDALYRGKVVGKKSKNSQLVADFINYNIATLSTGWMNFCKDLTTDQLYGMSLFNKVSAPINTGDYKGKGLYKIDKLSPRSPHLLHGWIWDKNFQEVIGTILKPMLYQTGDYLPRANSSYIPTGTALYDTNFPIMWKHQMLHSVSNGNFRNPEGISHLVSCYSSYKEKKLVEQYEIIGISKDFGGIAVLRVDPELIERAGDPILFPNDKIALDALELAASKLHAGESTHLLLSSELQEGSSTIYKYDFKLQGIDGGGKQYKSSDIISQKNKDIYNAFGCGFLILGQDGVGSYNLSTTGESVHDSYVKSFIQAKVDVINSQFIKTIIDMNSNNPMFKLAWDEMPEFVPADFKRMDLDVLSKIVQRMKSVEGLPPQVLTQLLDMSELTTEGVDELNFQSKGASRAGESLGSSGTGNTQDGGVSSTVNANNGGVTKALNAVVYTDKQGNQHLIDTDTDSVILSENT